MLFPRQQWVRNGKYTDFDYFHNDRLGGDNFCRTDNIRVFSAGLVSANEYYLLNKRLLSKDPSVAYEQGFNTGLNMQALVSDSPRSASPSPTCPSNASTSSANSCTLWAPGTSSTPCSSWATLKSGTLWPSMLSEHRSKQFAALPPATANSPFSAKPFGSTACPPSKTCSPATGPSTTWSTSSKYPLPYHRN
jgi:hypothetical protein